MTGPLKVDPQCYYAAAKGVHGCGEAVVAAVAALGEKLESTGQMAGTHSAGRSWSAAYDVIVRAVLGAAVNLSRECGTKAQMLSAVGAVYAGAEAGSDTRGVCLVDAPPHLAEITGTVPVVPSATGGEGGAPGWWHYVVAVLHELWPDAGVDKLHAARDGWNAFAAAVGNAASGIDDVVTKLQSQQTPNTDMQVMHLQDLQLRLAGCVGYGTTVATMCDEYAFAVEACRAILVGLGAVVAAGVILTLGAAALSGAAEGVVTAVGGPALAALNTAAAEEAAVLAGAEAESAALAAQSATIAEAESAAVAATDTGAATEIAAGEADAALTEADAQASQIAAKLKDSPYPEEIKEGYDPYPGMTPKEFREKYGGWGPNDKPIAWPDDAGFAGKPTISDSIPSGAKLDRVGDESGEFLGDRGEPLASRSMHPDSVLNNPKGLQYHTYEGTGEPVPDEWRVESGKAAPAFGQPGGGIQWVVYNQFNKEVSVRELVRMGILRRTS